VLDGIDLLTFDKDGTFIEFHLMRMARAAGAGRVIGVLTGVGDRASLEPLADAVLGSIADLREA
jgi:hypothetical protein